MHHRYPASTAILVATIAMSSCGPSVRPSDGSGSGDAGSGSDPASSSETTPGSTTVANTQPDCSRSDLPPPFCHELVLIGSWGGDYEAAHDDLRDGLRPVLLSDDLGLRLVNPFDPAEVFSEIPLFEGVEWPNVIDLAQGDFDGDGDTDFAVVHRATASDFDLLSVLDGQTLEPFASYDFGGRMTEIAALDLDGDGTDELLSGHPSEWQATLNAWRVEDGTLSLIATEPTGADCDWDFVRGDFDGDGLRDVSMVWSFDCDYWFIDLMGFESSITSTVLGGSGVSGGLDIRLSAQPTRYESAAGDFDGDGDDEVLVAEDLGNIFIMDWTAEGFVDAGMFGVTGDLEPAISTTLASGAYIAGRPHGVIMGNVARYQGGEVVEVLDVAMFPADSTTDAIDVPHALTTPSADYNADGIADFRAATADNTGYYLSIK